ncbi:hypothetical protein LOC67_24630 [Stieleria sp. JC731]|uniref:hypothetical protein n=1 Tax=Pirellulaceae TaxID=2691357 RepID=UPI001E48A1A1|nr:hypothetical protein [Stieleria sp. JC731]MCC9603749.1 hypothetical protein [Stieleria sp. JC731]
MTSTEGSEPSGLAMVRLSRGLDYVRCFPKSEPSSRSGVHGAAVPHIPIDLHMPWTVVERKIGRAGSIKRRTAKQEEWNRKYGDWAIGYVLNGEFTLQDDAIDTIYYQSYAEHFSNNPDDLEELITLAKILRNPHAVATTGVDLQVPAIMDYLNRHDLELCGDSVVDIGTYDGECSHPISVRLSPLTIRCCVKPKMTLESYWQEKKVLAVYTD